MTQYLSAKKEIDLRDTFTYDIELHTNIQFGAFRLFQSTQLLCNISREDEVITCASLCICDGSVFAGEFRREKTSHSHGIIIKRLICSN